MGGTGASEGEASRFCAEVDERVGAFPNRPTEGEWPCPRLDATCVEARRVGRSKRFARGRVASVAAIVAVAVNADGGREVPGMTAGNSGAEPFRTEFLRGLARRGPRGVKPAISDAHEGPKAAADRAPGATAQRCRVHFSRDAMAHAGRTQRRIASARSGEPLGSTIGTAFAEADRAAARERWRAAADRLRSRVPKLAALMDGAEEGVSAYVGSPAAHRAKIGGTNHRGASTARSSAAPT